MSTVKLIRGLSAISGAYLYSGPDVGHQVVVEVLVAPHWHLLFRELLLHSDSLCNKLLSDCESRLRQISRPGFLSRCVLCRISPSMELFLAVFFCRLGRALGLTPLQRLDVSHPRDGRYQSRTLIDGVANK